MKIVHQLLTENSPARGQSYCFLRKYSASRRMVFGSVRNFRVMASSPQAVLPQGEGPSGGGEARLCKLIVYHRPTRWLRPVLPGPEEKGPAMTGNGEGKPP